MGRGWSSSYQSMRPANRRPFHPVSMSWHPKQPILAVGWVTGVVSLCNIKSTRSKEEGNYHQSAVLRTMFNDSGDRMATVDHQGNIAVWKDMNCLCVYEKGCQVTCMASANITVERKNKAPKNLNLFFVGGADGIVWYANDTRCEELCQLASPIVSLMFYKEKRSVVLLTAKMDLFQFNIAINRNETPHIRNKLTITADPRLIRMQWIEPTSFAITCGDSYIRIWNVESNQNYALTFVDPNQSHSGITIINGKVITCKFNQATQTLYAGSSDGKVLAFRNMLNGLAPTNSEQWRSVGSIAFSEQVTNIESGKCGIVTVQCSSSLSMIYETKLGGRMSEKFKVLQASNSSLQIYYTDSQGNNKVHVYDARMNIKCFDLSSSKLLVWNGLQSVLCDINPNAEGDSIITQCGSFECTGARFLCFHKDGVIIISSFSIKVVNFQGVVKQEINFPKLEGEIEGYDYGKGSLVVYTNNQYLRVIDISKREVKIIGMVKQLQESTGRMGLSIKSISVNSKGSKVMILVNPTIDNEKFFFVWNIDEDCFSEYTCKDGFLPNSGSWEESDPRFFAVLGVITKESGVTVKGIQSFFISSENKIKYHDSLEKDNIDGIFGVKVPNFLCIIKDNSMKQNINYTLRNEFIRQFAGVDPKDEVSVASLINFNYHLTDGNMDEAHRSIKHISSAEIWTNMAKMSIKNRRVDVAQTCIANMQFARGAKGIREFKDQDELSKLASIAILLNMLDEAKELLIEAKRYDLLNILYQDENDWDEALKIAETHDRINLRSTYFKAAQNFEMHKNLEEAKKYYELSEAGPAEIPRMLYENENTVMLEEYANSINDPKVFSFYGEVYQQYGYKDEAKTCFNKAKDYGSIVRCEINDGNIQAAESVCQLNDDPLACFWLAKHFEKEGKIKKALEYYKRGRHYSQSIRIAKEGGEDEEVFSTALKAPHYVQCRAASYFEKQGFSEKAVILYMKGKNFKKAMDLAMAHNLGEYIQQITSEIDSTKGQPKNMGKFAEMFEDKGDIDKAFGMYLGSGQKEKALELLEKDNIKLNRDSLRQLIPEKGENDAFRDKAIRIVAMRLAEQGMADAAAKYYIEAGEPILALKAIISGGDTEKVIKFANVSRSNDAYVLAANFLQSADWHSDPKLMKYIAGYYKKAKRFDYLANFYSSCAMLEIDEYKNYDKALNAIKVARKHAESGADTSLIASLDEKIVLLQKYIDGKAMLTAGDSSGVAVMREIVDDPLSKDALRVGDAYSLIFEHYAKSNQYNEAWSVIEEMKKKNYQVGRYLDIQYLEQVIKKMGKNAEKDTKPELAPWDNQHDEPLIDDDIEDELDFDLN